jgi:hypothetical protein
MSANMCAGMIFWYVVQVKNEHDLSTLGVQFRFVNFLYNGNLPVHELVIGVLFGARRHDWMLKLNKLISTESSD